MKSLFSKLGGLPDDLDRFAKAGALEALGLAKNEAPVDENTLRDSINIEPNRFLADKGIYTIKANVFYAPYVEFGTGEKVSIPNGLEKVAAEFKGEKKIVGQTAQPFLYPSALEGQKVFKNLLLKWIKINKNKGSNGL